MMTTHDCLIAFSGLLCLAIFLVAIDAICTVHEQWERRH